MTPKRKKLNFSYAPIDRFCKEKNLTVNEELLELADGHFKKHGLNHPQAIEMLMLYCTIQLYIYNRKNYTFWQRVKMAFWWLGFGKGHNDE